MRLESESNGTGNTLARPTIFTRDVYTFNPRNIRVVQASAAWYFMARESEWGASSPESRILIGHSLHVATAHEVHVNAIDLAT